MISVISRLISMEQESVEITRKAFEEKKLLSSIIKQKKEKIATKVNSDTETQIAAITKEENELLKVNIESMARDINDKKDKLMRSFKDNHDNIENAIFNKIINL